MGLLDQPSAPILGVNGKLDDQAPVDDIYLLMEHGSPKSARIYPNGHHMSRRPSEPRRMHGRGAWAVALRGPACGRAPQGDGRGAQSLRLEIHRHAVDA